MRAVTEDSSRRARYRRAASEYVGGSQGKRIGAVVNRIRRMARQARQREIREEGDARGSSCMETG